MGGAAPNYQVYFGVMACNNFDKSTGTNSNSDLPDSLEIADFQAWMGANSASLIAACPANGCAISYKAPTSKNPSTSSSPSLQFSAGGGMGMESSWPVSLNNNALYSLGSKIKHSGCDAGCRF